MVLSYISDVETNECLDNNGGCWQDKAANITACKVLALTCGIFTTVSLSKFFYFTCLLALIFYNEHLICMSRTHFVAGYVNAL